ncbi:MAG: efflux RND transporter periplasmic adaptor subunit [Halioglobus sp.]
MNNSIKYALLLLTGAVIGALAYSLLVETTTTVEAKMSPDEPIYWVAPMDPSYRRDGPGKSPMGMDLVPVYDKQVDAGTVEISPAIVNNLGVRTNPVELDRLQEDIHTVGYVQYDQDRLIHIHPRVDGWIEKLYVKAAGDPVSKGQPLYEIYSPQLVNAQDELILALRRKNERLIQASENRLRSLQFTDEHIQQLKKDLQVRQTVTFRSPQEGVVDNLNIREGFFVGPNTTLMSIGALDDVWVEAEVFERQAALVQPGQPVTMRLDYLPGREWQGKVDYIYPSLEASTRTLRVRLRFTNQSGELRPNMFAQVTIHSLNRDEVLVIPKEALIRTERQERVVLALGEGQFKSIVVKAGRIAGGSVEILSGLSQGDIIVTSAQFLLDSESSKSADFDRMNSEKQEHLTHD